MLNLKFDLRTFLLLILVGVLATTGVWAQATSSVAGKLQDPTGAVIPGVEVTVTNKGTGEARTVLTGDAGTFRVTNLNPGNYEVKASLTGFKTAVGNVTTTVGEVVTVNLVLEVGAVSDIVTVTDAATTVNVEQGRVSSLVDQKRVVDLPLNGRDVYQLIQLTPGAVNTEATVFEPGGSPTGSAVANVNGGRLNMNGFWLDGVSSTGLSGGSNIQPNVDSIQEFRIETLNFSAEFGSSVGSVVNVVTKSGTNDFHGSVYEFHRNDNLNAREFFDSDKPEFKQNQFGVSFGGPIAKDSTFFFGSYEGTRIRTGDSTLRTFESQAWSNYVQSFGQPVGRFLYNTYGYTGSLESVSSTVGQYLVDFGYVTIPDGDNRTAANQAEVDAALGGLFGSSAGSLAASAPMFGTTGFFTPDATDTDQFSIRLDQEIGSKDKVYGRYFISDTGAIIVDPRPAFNAPQIIRSHQLALNWTHIFSPTVVNEARGGLNRGINDILAGDPGTPRINDAGTGTEFFGAYNGYPQIFHENVFNYADTVSVNKGNHGIKFGGEYRRNQENSEFNVGRPSYYFFDLVYVALDDPYYQIGGVDPNFDEGPGHAELSSNFRGWRNREFGFFINDDWKVKSNLTLNLGLRWDYYGRLNEVQNRATAFDLGDQGDFFQHIRDGQFIGPVDSLSANDLNNFAPRLGLAWDPFSDGKMSFRMGYGIAYQSGIYNPLANSRWNKPFYSFNLICDVCGRVGENILYGPQTPGVEVRAGGPNPNVGGRLFEGTIIAYDPNNPNLAFLSGIPNPRQRDPYVQSFFVGIQRELFRDSTLEINYVGTLGRKLIRAENPNRFTGDRIGLPSPTGEFAGDNAFNRVNPNEGTLRFWENSVNSNYNALQVQFNRRFNAGFALNTNYTWAKSLDVRSTWHSGATSSNRAQEGYSTDISNVALDYGRSVFDARHRFVANWLWEAPWLRGSSNWFLKNVVGGWQINGIVALQSGQPFTPYCGLSFPAGCDFNADGNNNDRPNTPSLGNSFSGPDRLAYVNSNGGPFNIPTASANGIPTTDEKLAFFGIPAPGAVGTLGRNTYDGPGFANVDFSLFKEFGFSRVTEGAKLQLRFEFFNILNRGNFFQPEPRIERSTFGQATDTFDAREIQLGVKFIF